MARAETEVFLKLFGEAVTGLQNQPVPADALRGFVHPGWAFAGHPGPGAASFNASLPSCSSANTGDGDMDGVAGQDSTRPPRRATNGAAASRKRGPTAAQQVKELEGKLREQQDVFRREALHNLYLKERARMLELVIDVKEEQLARARLVRSGSLPKDLFKSLGMTVEEVIDFAPAHIAGQFTSLCNGLAMRLAGVMPLLDRYPHLLAKAVHPHTALKQRQVHRSLSGSSNSSGSAVGPASWMAAAKASGPAAVISAGVEGRPHTALPSAGLAPEDLPQLAALQAIVNEMESIQTACSYVLLLSPSAMLGCNMHVDVLSRQGDWESTLSSHSLLRTTAAEEPQAVGSRGGGGGAGLLCSPTPDMAPEAHWRAMVASMRLSDQQRLQALVLYDLVSAGLRAVLTQRSGLLAAVTSVTSARRVGLLQRPVPESGLKTTEEWLREAQLMEQLNTSLIKERCFMMLASEVFHHHILSPVQCVLGLVHAFPYIPDDLAALAAAAAEYDPQLVSFEALQAAHCPAPTAAGGDGGKATDSG